MEVKFTETMGRSYLYRNGERETIENIAWELANSEPLSAQLIKMEREINSAFEVGDDKKIDNIRDNLSKIGESLLREACEKSGADYSIIGEGAFIEIDL